MWTNDLTNKSTKQLEKVIYGQAFHAFQKRQNLQKKRNAFWLVAHTLLILSALTLIQSLFSPRAHAETGIATWYSVQSTKAEGNTGITASGERLCEKCFTAALRSRKFGSNYKVTNLKTKKSIVVKHNDYGPGKKPARRGVIIDLTPAAFDALGGKRGATWGEFPVRVEVIK